MKCLNCNTKMNVTVENVKYRALPGITLGGIEVRRCPECGHEEIVIPQIEHLNRFLVTQLAEKKPKLTGQEIRFLRKYLGWSGTDFAESFDVKPETVSRWENDHEPMGSTAERLLRYVALTTSPAEKYPIDLLKVVAHGHATPLKAKVVQRKEDWETASSRR